MPNQSPISQKDQSAFSSRHGISHRNTASGVRRPALSRTQSNYASATNSGTSNTVLNSKSTKASGRERSSSTSSNGSSAPTLNAATTGDSRKTRVKSMSQTLANNLHNSNQYLAQERAYLRRIRNQWDNDYYTKGIKSADDESSKGEINNNEDDEDDDDFSTYGNTDLLIDMDDEKYQIDYSLAFDIMKSSNSNINFDKSNSISEDTVKDPAVLERLDWQAMLSSVLTGDVVRSEKTKIIDNTSVNDGQEPFLHTNYKENLWFGIRAKLFNRTEDDQKKIIFYRRTLTEQLIEEIMSFELSYDKDSKSPRQQVVEILEKYERVCDQWQSLEDMKHDKPACRSEAFQNRIDALNAWLSITDAIERESQSFKSWVGNDDLDIMRGKADASVPNEAELERNSLTSSKNKVVKKIFEEDNKSLAERLMKEKDVHTIFRKRIFIPLAPWMVKSRETYINLGHIFEMLKLPDYIHDLIQLCLIPLRLIKEIINIRMKYALKLQNPTLMMIDQMIEDFKSYITIALEVKNGIMSYCKPDENKTWLIEDLFDSDILDFDKVVLQCVRYFLVLLNRKLIDSSKTPSTFRTNKEPEELEDTWNFLKSLGEFIDGGSIVVAENITLITSRLCQKLLSYLNNQIKNPPSSNMSSSELIRWYNSTTENFGQLRRKLARFTSELSRSFTNSVAFEIPTNNGSRTKALLEALKSTNHFLVYTGTVEAQGMYFFSSPELRDNESEILRIINGSRIGIDQSESFDEFVSLLNMVNVSGMEFAIPDEYISNLGYVLALCPPKPIVWEGDMITLNIKEVPISDVKVGQMLFVTSDPEFNLMELKSRFVETVTDAMGGGNTLKVVEQRSSLAKVHHELTKINKIFFKMTLAILDSVKIIMERCKKLIPSGGYQELVNSYFIYARDFGKGSVKWADPSKKSTVIMKLIQLSIQWVSFICDDCIPTDRKTFRWCVLALEFSMEMTRGFNVLVLNEEQFNKLRLKVARCMSLLISHFDIMGARSSEAEKKKLLKWTSQRHKIENTTDDEYILTAYREDVMREIEEIENYRAEVQEQLNSIGRVLDVSDSEYHFVKLLASSFSSVSIRWQKGRFIGGGSFGQVFAAVNLDTGGVMAVKEIRFHDSQSIKIIPSIRDEMTVLEMLNHPNVVQYFGVEVHRDKVYIFMEFCEGGSLSGLLAHGRIEDEMVIQVYTLQMLEGLAYLHQSGVVHRDIKPENILLDHNGVIKFVDFGAAKNNPENLNSMTGTPMYMSPEVITGQSTAKNGIVDIWSLGCCVLEMATGRRPWANLDNEWAIMYHIAAGHKPQLPSPDQLSESGRKFLSRCLEHDPTKRPSAVELLSDPWIVQIRQAAFGSSDGSTPSSEHGPAITPTSEASAPLSSSSDHSHQFGEN
ncbi:uncharacterized protein CXQ87_003973 [Candidozyma duobushaemuli]|uniref:MAP kinase kinase kinase n=1 Tax=Candidozyma duobushaemuli TaxID=1231522 RepID=A0A2V1ADK9_9ASCO|nr:uncharacterized protein CXQ87_003973 [[Candida] duobushaemulonis]PVH16109.1 hypothetical protein CXQ87_003973 [[Candida] duobushaemulonis]